VMDELQVLWGGPSVRWGGQGVLAARASICGV
jgi:hypothetical protein